MDSWMSASAVCACGSIGSSPVVLADPLLLRQILSREPEPIRSSRPDVPVELEAIILRLLAKNPQDRFATPMDLWTELQFRS